MGSIRVIHEMGRGNPGAWGQGGGHLAASEGEARTPHMSPEISSTNTHVSPEVSSTKTHLSPEVYHPTPMRPVVSGQRPLLRDGERCPLAQTGGESYTQTAV